MSQHLVSVLMPAYNAQDFIGSAIESVLNQTYANFELLIINDCSTDQTAKVIANYTDKRITVITHTKNQGLSPTLNEGLAVAKGSLIARLDADDIAYPTRLAEQVRCFVEEPTLGLVSSWTAVINQTGKVTGYAKWIFTPEALYYLLHFRNCLTHSSIMLKRSVALAAGGYTLAQAEDQDLWSKIVKTAKIRHLHRVLVQWRDIPTSLSRVHARAVDQGALKHAQTRLYEATDKKYPLSIIAAFAHGSAVSDLTQTERQTLSQELPKIMNVLLEKAPPYCDKKILKEYMLVELAKYSVLLSRHGVVMDTGPFQLSLGHHLHGYLLCGARYGRNRLFSILIPKLHL